MEYSNSFQAFNADLQALNGGLERREIYPNAVELLVVVGKRHLVPMPHLAWWDVETTIEWSVMQFNLGMEAQELAEWPSNH